MYSFERDTVQILEINFLTPNFGPFFEILFNTSYGILLEL